MWSFWFREQALKTTELQCSQLGQTLMPVMCRMGNYLKPRAFEQNSKDTMKLVRSIKYKPGLALPGKLVPSTLVKTDLGVTSGLWWTDWTDLWLCNFLIWNHDRQAYNKVTTKPRYPGHHLNRILIQKSYALPTFFSKPVSYNELPGVTHFTPTQVGRQGDHCHSGQVHVPLSLCAKTVTLSGVKGTMLRSRCYRSSPIARSEVVIRPVSSLYSISSKSTWVQMIKLLGLKEYKLPTAVNISFLAFNKAKAKVEVASTCLFRESSFPDSIWVMRFP